MRLLWASRSMSAWSPQNQVPAWVVAARTASATKGRATTSGASAAPLIFGLGNALLPEGPETERAGGTAAPGP